MKTLTNITVVLMASLAVISILAALFMAFKYGI
jgi:hypothetical protein